LDAARRAVAETADDLRDLTIRRRLEPSNPDLPAALEAARRAAAAARAGMAATSQDAVEELAGPFGQATQEALLAVAGQAPGEPIDSLSVVERPSSEARAIRLARIAERRAIRMREPAHPAVQGILGPARADYRVVAAQSNLQLHGPAVRTVWSGLGLE
jgi:hypothetical protein